MPPRGKTPGLKRGRHNLPYWIATQVRRDIMHFPDKCIPLPPDADEETLSRLCHEYSARLDDHIARRLAGEPEPARYDGTVQAACQLYQTHPHSPFRSVKFNSRTTYVKTLGLIERTVGKRLIRNLTVIDVQHWFAQWRAPAKEGAPERQNRAHRAVATFRTVIRFCAALRHADCKQLAEELKFVKFEKAGARSEEMTAGHVGAFIKKAFDMARAGIIPLERARGMAIGVAAQFDLALRQRDIIGEWRPDGTWSGLFAWENIPGWRWRMRTSKSKYRAGAEFDLTNYGYLFPLLENVPLAERHGAIVKGERGLPIRYSTYAKWFRKIAHAAGIPDTVWSMDARAGAATEAEEAGVAIGLIQEALTHADSRMTVRYIRRRTAKIAEVADARARKRAGDPSDGGTA